MRHGFAPWILIAAFALAASGCQTTVTDPAPPSEETQASAVIDLDSRTGGLTETDEPIAFGDPESFAVLETAEREYDDPLGGEERIRNMERRDGVRIYRLRALWGKVMHAAADTVYADCCPVDWSGGMHLAGGIIVVERVILFEPGEFVTRVSPSAIRWNSQTCPHVDGLQVRLIVPPVVSPDDEGGRPDTIETAEPLLTIRTGPFSRTFTLDELEAMRLLEPVDRCNNYMMIRSHRILPGCPRGYLMGAWTRSEEPDTLVNPDTGETRGVVLGRFKGIWVSELGRAAGHVRGFYGLNSAGEMRFFGKYISMSGEFMGILAGDWGIDPDIAYDDPAGGRGWFEGVWYGRNCTVHGRLKGEWITGGPGTGYFEGLWARSCSEAI
ncbi:MAG: hypothetical protein PHQ19_07685 [Candidatus Krumholzibacteria bacterium]|nr:hypothetical protein [Candidatus Krumholzibacteria bacterium]